jgi:hypothetical protein
MNIFYVHGTIFSSLFLVLCSYANSRLLNSAQRATTHYSRNTGMADTPLESVPGWSKEDVAHMKKSWITTAEQVVALGATTDGIRSVAEQLGVPEDEARRLIEAARMKLPPATRQEMERPADTSDYGLGVLPPRERKEDN